MSNPSSRPLSPHLQVWKWTLTMALSILHRATGCALAVGMLVFVWWLVAAVGGAGTYDEFLGYVRSPLGQLLLLGWSFALYLHLCTGVRHLLMDAGYLLTIKSSNTAGIVIILSAIALTAATWARVKGLI